MPIVEVAAALLGSEIIKTCWQGAVGNYAHSGCEWLRGRIPKGTPENHDVLKAMHHCFQQSIKVMADACSGADGSNADSRVARRRLGDYARSTALARLDLEAPDIPEERLEAQIREIYGRQPDDAKAVATDQIIAFVEAKIGCALTPALREIFQGGGGKDGWATTFELLFAAEIKRNDKVERILMASRANELVALATDQAIKIEGLFDRLDGIADKIDRGFDQVAEQFDHVAGQNAAILAELKVLRERMAASGVVGEAQADSFAEAVINLAQSSDADDRAIAAQAVEGDPISAGDRLMAEVSAGRQRNAERSRQAARLYAPFAPSKAMAAYKEATDLDPDDVWSWIELGRLRATFETLEAAKRCFDIALQRVSNELHRGALHDELGRLAFAHGNLGVARSEYEKANAVARRLVKRIGTSVDERNLSVSHNKLGDVEWASDNLDAAREHYAAGLAIAERLAAQDPANTQFQRDLTISFNKLGDVERASGNLDVARERYVAVLAIRERLAIEDPGNTEWQRDLTVSHNKLGDVERASGNLDAARECYAAGLAIRELLAAQEPRNTEWRRDLMVSYNKLGDVERASGNLDVARERYAAGLAIAKQLVDQGSGNTEWQRDLCIILDRLARIEEAEGNLVAAIRHYHRAEIVMAALVASAPDHPGYAKVHANVLAALKRLRS